MRVATNAYTDSMLNQLGVLASKQYSLQTQVSTGLRVQTASDDPVAVQNTLNNVATKASLTQYSANITTLQSRADSVYSVLESLQTISSRAGEIATSAATATTSTSDLANYADEINSLIQEVVSAANTKDAATGKYLFGGTASDDPPYVVTTDGDGNITAVTYQGNASVNQAQIGTNLTTSVDIPGDNTGGSGTRGLITDEQSGADFINHLISLRDNLVAGDKDAITDTDAANLQKDEDNLAYQIANNGVRQNQLTAAATLLSSRSDTLDETISNDTSADLLQTMVDLTAAQTAYEAALQSGAKIMQMSILNYL